ncbi:MAG: tetratricopeptide repeat protein [Armatimonadetes bacterium]|nr:tetratricopeptide repeat protein [Armatimonadota bacterium]
MALTRLARRIELDETHALHLVTVVPFVRVPECAAFLQEALGPGVHHEEVRFAGPVTSPIAELLERAPEVCFATDAHPVLTPDDRWLLSVYGLDASLDPRANPEAESALLLLNLHRDRLLRLRAPTLLWLREDTLQRIATRLADFWSWVGGVVEVREPLAPARSSESAASGADWRLLSLTEPAKRARMAALAPLLTRLHGTGASLAREDRFLLVNALLELGVLQESLGEWDAAQASFAAARDATRPSAEDDDREALRLHALAWGRISDLLQTRGEVHEALRILNEECLPVHERLQDVRSRAITWGWIADIYQARGDLDEALRIRQVECLPVYERLQDLRERAVTWGQIATIRMARGDLDEALRIRQQQELPVYERLQDVHSRAITWGQIADIYQARGDLDEALRIRRAEELPVYERLQDVHSRAITWGKIAEIRMARGDLDEACRIWETECLPVFARLGDARSQAVTWGKIADSHARQGDLGEAIRIREMEVLPLLEHLGAGPTRVAERVALAVYLRMRGREEDREAARHLLDRSRQEAEELGLAEALADIQRVEFWWNSGAFPED